MASNSDALIFKESFLQQTQLFSELELTEDMKPIGKIQEIDLLENEIWLLQCPKGMDVTELENQKLKIPGRTNVNNSEAVSMEFNEGRQQHAFAYCNRKGRYALRLLPVRGTIVIRDRLKAAESITAERAEECCPPPKRVPVPSSIRLRHPLLGHQFDDKLDLDKITSKRLQKADKISAHILKESLTQKTSRKLSSKNGHNIPPIEINSDNDNDDAVEFVSEEKLKKKNRKRKNSKSIVEKEEIIDISLSKKSKKKDKEEVSKDLQWLQNI